MREERTTPLGDAGQGPVSLNRGVAEAPVGSGGTVGQAVLDYSSPYPSGLPGFHKEARETEVAASVKAAKTAGAGCQRVLAMLREAGIRGLTDLEMQAVYFSAPKRRCDLTHAGLVVDSGQRRKTPRGSLAVVWILAELRP